MIIILGAMENEIESFLGALEETSTHEWNGFARHRGRLGGHEVLISRSGVGKVMAAMVTQNLIDTWKPRALLFTGIAGSLRETIDIGDTLLGRDLVQHDMDTSGLGIPRGQIPFTDYRFLPADPALLAIAQTYRPPQGQLHSGRICTGDQFITHRDLDSHRYLFDELDGDGVEMEGAAVAQVCALNRLPCLVARTISDRADGKAAESFAAFLPRASLNSLSLVRHILAALPTA
ncbi:5'-methylthioadenosine/adenosylhomocysteine nucleosidase [Uliginosibacterium paludis]|uniref:adenosylhomocysteine nucleosidase n=1 Tax=Uliginosibacterium paludis TaxID=1615952 RepID=A0ABV2CS81_9RHOO